MAENKEQHYLLLQQLLEQNRVSEALVELKLLLSAHPEEGRAYALQGHLLWHRLKDLAGAEAAFRQAMRYVPELPALYYDFGALLLSLDKNTETIAVLNKALEVRGIEKERVFRMMGQLYEREQRWTDAIDYYTRALLYSLSESFVLECRKDLLRVKMKMQLPG